MSEHAATERAGAVTGWTIAPIVAAVSAVRRARMFHPRGVVYEAIVRPSAVDGGWGALARRLEGKAIVRLSSAWWKSREWRDVLGCAIRFEAGEREGDQDLLFATIKHPWTMPFAPLTTDHHDFLANHYYAVSPFCSEDAGLIDLRLRPERASDGFGSREERLARAVEDHTAVLVLEARRHRRALDLRHHEPHAIAVIELVQRAEDVDQERLRFDPFKSGRGIEPAGFVNALRIGAYRASQKVRPRRERH